jgi:hypothetical protein
MNNEWTQQTVYMGLNMEDGTLYVEDTDDYGLTNGDLCILYNPYTMGVALMFRSPWMIIGPWDLPANWTLVSP